jgi:hypothetical protein
MDHSPINQNFDLNKSRQNSIIAWKSITKLVIFQSFVATGEKIVVADQIYLGRFLFASKNCENNKNTWDFATLFLVLQQRKSKRKPADVNINKR